MFEPLQELLSYACRNQPQLLILVSPFQSFTYNNACIFEMFCYCTYWSIFSLLQMGPFIDSDHPVIKKGTVDQYFHDIFCSEVLRKVDKCWFLKMLHWQIVKCKRNFSVIYFCSDSRLYPIFGEHCSCNYHSICAWCSPWLCFPSGLYFSLLRFRSGCVLKIRDSDLI